MHLFVRFLPFSLAASIKGALTAPLAVLTADNRLRLLPGHLV